MSPNLRECEYFGDGDWCGATATVRALREGGSYKYYIYACPLHMSYSFGLGEDGWELYGV